MLSKDFSLPKKSNEIDFLFLQSVHDLSSKEQISAYTPVFQSK